MAKGFQKGHDKVGGKAKGTPNKSTSRAKEAIADFVDFNSRRLQEWLDIVAQDDPKEAIRLFVSLVEFHVPKQARTELTGKDNTPLEIVIKKRD